MLRQEKPDVITIAPRFPGLHEEMLMAAVESGVRAIYSEKPFARTLEEADRMLAACDAKGVKVAVAHQVRTFNGPSLARDIVASGRIGRLRTLRAFGKCDRRGGGQDLMVLGTHLMDLLRFFAGDPRWCQARVCQDGRDVTPADVREGAEQIGPIAGNDIIAQYGFDHGITGSFESVVAGDGGGLDYFRIELGGTAGTVTMWINGNALHVSSRPFTIATAGPAQDATVEIVPIDELPVPSGALPDANGAHAGNQLLVRDLLAAVESGAEPMASGHNARAALEMILAVYESHTAGQRVPLALADRTHPLMRWKA
jgi:predicted dehydrogenase